MKPMNAPDDEKLRTLLRALRPAPSLPPRFEENVWRRIEGAEVDKIPVAANWLDALATWVSRPRLALALAAVLVLAGIGLGWSHGEQAARNEAQTRYLTAVAPNALR
jgi:hypothetical protein